MKIKMVSLSNNEEFKNIIKGKRINNKYFTIFFKKIINKNTQFLNISFVTKRKLGNAVKRNKIKRRLRQIMRDAINKISLNLNYSYLIIAKSAVLKDEYTSIKKTVFSNFEGIK